ncbi:MAG: helix-turn-helix domain-containing protein [Armatimonadetes bacterium]|nr:helix-turn-helix domain-containing protein [Armatimonadota bacterium]
MDRRFYSPDEFADMSGMSRNHTYTQIREGTIPSIRLGRRILIPREAIERLAQQAMDPQAPAPGGGR